MQFSVSKHYNMAHYKQNPNWLNITENLFQLQTEMKEPGMRKCWRLNAEDDMMKMQLQLKLQTRKRTWPLATN